MKCDDDTKVNTPHTNKTLTVTLIHINVNFKMGTWAEYESQHIYDISAWCGDRLFPLKSSPSRLCSQTHQQVLPLTHFLCAVVLQNGLWFHCVWMWEQLSSRARAPISWSPYQHKDSHTFKTISYFTFIYDVVLGDCQPLLTHVLINNAALTAGCFQEHFLEIPNQG